MNKKRNLLVVDDDKTNTFVTKMILNPLGLFDHVEYVANGKEAVHYFQNGVNPIPDLVLLDLNMPIMTGLEFLNWYEKSPHYGKTKFSILSSSVKEEDMNLSDQFADVIGFIEKPISKKNILDILQKI